MHFLADELERVKNVEIADGEVRIRDFPEPGDAHVKVPHMRKLVYLENGIAVVVKAEADAVLDGDKAEPEQSLEKFKRTDRQLMLMMASLVGP